MSTKKPTTHSAAELHPGKGVRFSRGSLYLLLAGLLVLLIWAARTRIDIAIESTGTLTAPAGAIPVYVHEAAPVAEIHVGIGQHVEQGELLFSLEDRRHKREIEAINAELQLLETEREELRIQADEIRAIVELAKRELEPIRNARAIVNRQLELLKKLSETTTVVSPSTTELKEAERLSLEAQTIRLAREMQAEMHRMARIRRQAETIPQRRAILLTRRSIEEEAVWHKNIPSPAAGMVLELAVSKPAHFAGPPHPAARILPAGTPLAVQTDLPAKALRRIRTGLPVRLLYHPVPPVDPPLEYAGTVQSIDPAADPQTGLHRVWIALEETSPATPELKPGANLRVFILIEQRTILQSVFSLFQKRDPVIVRE